MKETTLYIKGMDCEDEARLIRAKLDGMKGIEGYEINIISGSLLVRHTPSVQPESIVRAIAKTGLVASAKKEEKKPDTKSWWQEPIILLLSIGGMFILLSLIAEHALGISHERVRVIYAAAVFSGGYYPAKMGIVALINRAPNIRTLMVAGAAGAISLGLWEEAALLVLIYSLGDILEAFATNRVRGAVKALMGLAPKEAHVKRDGLEVTVALEDVLAGDSIIVKPGERLPLDGIILSGSSSIDQSPITGESIPVSKSAGQEVFAGSINQMGSLEVRVTKPFNDTTLGKIIHYVEVAETKKSGYQRFGEKFGRIYTPLMFLVSIFVMIVPPLFSGNWNEWFYRGLVLLVVSCSCGIALSIPVSVVAAIANAARHGVLIKGGAFIESASRVTAIAFDKTGSLTLGKPVVTDIVSFGNWSTVSVLSIAASIETRSEHILADAVLRKGEEKGISIKEIKDFKAIAGLGATATIDGVPYSIGSTKLLDKTGSYSPEEKEKITELESEGKSLILLSREDELIGAIAVRDEIRPEAEEALNSLKTLGVKGLVMLTGDNETVAKVIAKKSGITEYKARLLPEEKVAAIKTLKGRYDTVAMVCDGVNDAPAMVTSDLGIAMGGAGTDVAVETGDIVLMSDDLSKIPYVIGLSRRTVNNMRQNITISLSIIALLIPVALMGRIGLVQGLLINEIGGLLVIFNALRLLRG